MRSLPLDTPSATIKSDARPIAHHRRPRDARVCESRVRRLVELQARVADVPHPAPGIFLQASAQELADGFGGRRRQRGPVGFAFEDTDASVSVTVSPSNARRPVSISNSTQPNAQMSVRLSTACPRACSGLM